jgi:hypothetical protein
VGKHELARREVGDWVFTIGNPDRSELGDRVEPNSQVPFWSEVGVGGIALGLEEAEREPAIAGQELVAAGELSAS